MFRMSEFEMSHTAIQLDILLSVERNGFTVYPTQFSSTRHNPVTLQPLRDVVTGYLVAGIIPGEVNPSLPEIGEFVKRYNTAQLAMPELSLYLGGWTDAATTDTYLDVTILVSELDSAVELGRVWNQLAVGKVIKGEYVGTIELGVK